MLRNRCDRFLLAGALVLAGVLVFSAERGAGAEADAIAQIKPGEWYEVPDSHLEAVAAPAAKFPWLRGGIYGITACWAGGAFDSQRDRLYIGPGGGHAGYNGNEVYAFDLHDLKWHRINDPDPVIPGTEYTDLNKAPFAMHTYDGVEYVPPPTDRYVVIGGWGTPRTYALDPDHPDHWEVYPDHGTGRTGDICAYDPVGGLLWLSTPSTAGKLSQFDLITHQWTLRLNDSPHTSYYETADVDFKRRVMVSCGHGFVKTWSLKSIPELISFEELKTTGGDEILARSSPGFCYVPPLDKFVAWANGADVFTLDLDTRQWTRHAPAPTNRVTPGPADQWGTFGRFRYCASMNVFVLYNAVNQNVYLYRLTADRPNVITGVQAHVSKRVVETNIPSAAISVEAVYSDGSRRDVTGQGAYFSADPAIARVDLHGSGAVEGVAAGTARIRAVYTDPAFKRGFAAEVSIEVKDILPNATLDALHLSYPKVVLVTGDTFQLGASGAYTFGDHHFERSCTEKATWSSSAPQLVSVLPTGVIKALGKGGPAFVTATYGGKTDKVEVETSDTPVIRRVRFQVSDVPLRAGWDADNGKSFSDARGFGWLDAADLTTRDDRHPKNEQTLLKGFVVAKEKHFKVATPDGPYAVRIAMGDADYGAVPFDDWTSLGSQKLIYYEGGQSNIATRIVQSVKGQGLVFTVKGPINYLIVAPIGIDLAKYADDGTPQQ